MKNNLYTNQKRWKLALAVLAMIIIGITLYYTNHLVRRFAEQESKQIEMWAEAVQNHSALMDYTETFFSAVSEQEHKRVELLAKAYESFLEAGPNENTTIYLDIIQSNISILIIGY